MATTSMATAFKSAMLTALLVTGSPVIKALLIKASPSRTFDATQTNVGTPGTGTPSASNVGTDEVAAGGGYTANGNTLSGTVVTTSGTTAYADFADTSWTSASFSATALIIYRSAAGDVISVHDFGGTQTVASGTLTIVMPTADASNAILRIA